MYKKFSKYLKLFLTIMIIIPCIFVFSACSNGKSAYELAVENGYEGTLSEWLESLKGTNGKDGLNGKTTDTESSYEIWQNAVEHGEFSGTYLDFIQNKLNISPDDLSISANKAMSSVVEIQTNKSTGGSGVIYSIDGSNNAYIITNYHLVYGCSSFTFNFTSSTKKFNLSLVGGSATYDIAVLHVSSCSEFDNYNAKAVEFETKNVMIGSTCFAIGNSNLDGLSLTRGCISKDNDIRTLTVATTSIEHRLLCHDAYITNGNSGGGLFNNSGKLIGITNGGLKATASSSNDLINFAIPANIVKSVTENIINNSALITCNLGLNFTNSDYCRTLNLETGLYDIVEDIKISSIDANSPYLTDLQNGDKLKKIKITTPTETITKATNRLFDYEDLILILSSGSSIELTFERIGEQNDIVITKNYSDFTTNTII